MTSTWKKIAVGVIIGALAIVVAAIILGIPSWFQSDFSLIVEPNRGEVIQGERINTTIVLENLGGTRYIGNVSLVANLLNKSDVNDNLIHFVFDPIIVNLENKDKLNSIMSIKAGLDLPPGTYEIIVKGNGRDKTREISYILEVIPNYPPNITKLTPDKRSPQYSGTDITWNATANDSEDNILYKFWLKGLETSNKWEMKQDWSNKNSWVWKTKWDMPESKDPYNIKVSVRDGKHSSEEGEDSSLVVSDYYLKSPLLEVKIQNPSQNSEVPGGQIMVSGTISRPLENGRHMWILVKPIDYNMWVAQGGGEIIPWNGKWEGPAWIGSPADSGRGFNIAIISVDEEGNRYLVDNQPANTPLPIGAERLGEVTVVREK